LIGIDINDCAIFVCFVCFVCYIIDSGIFINQHEVVMQHTHDQERYPTTFRISDGLRKRLAEAAHIKRTTKNQFVVDALEAAVNEAIRSEKQ
jgi:uncharacterized ion transporter superfamily protein YfcC